jgi:hypothetical protein
MNSKVATLHGSTPYSLMFGRKHNAFTDHTQVELGAMTREALDARLNVLTHLVYPATNRHGAKGPLLTTGKGTEPHSPPKGDTFPPGTFVMAKDELRTSKAQPRYLGPFRVVRRNRGGAYILMDAANNPLTRAPEALKQVSINREFGDSSTVEGVIDHRGKRHDLEYLVKWLGLDSTRNSWVKARDFDSQGCILAYWKKQAITTPRI